jgi:heme exporter protein B
VSGSAITRRRIARVVAAKDLRIEVRSRVLTNQVLPFAGVTMVLFAFALDATDVLERVAPGLVWLATLFSMLVLVQRAFAVESDDGALDALRVAGVDPVAIFWGKSIALAAQLAVLELVLLVAAVVLYGASLPLGGVVLLVTTMLTATCGLACVGTLYGGLTAGFTGRETLLPLLVLPVVAPVLIGATRAVEAALGTGGMALSEGWPWIGLLGVFAVAFGVGGALAFGPLIDEAN